MGGANPYGENINYDSDFDVLKNEIGKLGNTDYDLVEKTSLKLLKEKSKDIRLLSFLSLVYLRREAWEHYADIFEGLASLAEQNYDGLFPDRERAKQMAFKWLSEDRYNDLLAERKPTEADYDHVARLVQALGKIKPVLESKFPEGSPFPSNIFKNAQLWEKSCKPKPKEAPPPLPAQPAAVAGSGAAASTTVSVTSAPAQSAEPMDTPKQAQNNAKKAAAFLIEKEPQKAMGYRLMRSIRWDILEKAPPSDGSKTQLQGPQPQQRTYFQNLLAQKDWKTALEKGEASFAGGANHLWLDLQRIIVTSCKELGDGYAAVSSAVLFETAYFLKRIPDLVSLSFSDGSPFCDDATKDWISTEVRSVSAGDSSAASAASGKDPVEEEQRKVNGLVAAGQIEDALDLVQTGIRSSANERDSFRRTIMVGSLLLKAKQPDIAISVLESLDQKITSYCLDRWEPDLAVEAWAVLVQAYKAGKVPKPQNIQLVYQEKQNTILSKISQIDPRKAFVLNK